MRLFLVIITSVAMMTGLVGERSTSANQKSPVGPGVKVLSVVAAGRIPFDYTGTGRPAWSPEGQRIAFSGRSVTGAGHGPIEVLDLASPSAAWSLTSQPGYDPEWHPDGQQLAFLGQRSDPAGEVTTIYLQALNGGEAEDLLPGAEATREIKSVGSLHRFLDGSSLAFDGLVGTGNRLLYTIDLTQRRREPGPNRLANYFLWSPNGERVVGQVYGYHAAYWLWDQRIQAYLTPTTPQPQEDQYFESWSDNGEEGLITSWAGGLTYWQRDGKLKGLWRLLVATGQRERVAAKAGLASWGREQIAYLRFGKTLTLVVAQAGDGKVLWTDDLGPVGDARAFRFWSQSFRPTFVGPYINYRTPAGEWRVSLAGTKQVRTLFVDPEAILSWSPDGRYVAVLDGSAEPRLWVLANPLWSP